MVTRETRRRAVEAEEAVDPAADPDGAARGGGTWFVVGGGVFTLIGAGWTFVELRQSGWPAVDGRLLEARVVQQLTSGDAESWEAQVRYEYEVRGARHEGRQMRAFFEFHARPTVESQVARVNEEQRRTGHVRVHVDPSDASRSALDVRPVLTGGAVLALGLSIAAIGLWQRTRRRVCVGTAVGAGAAIALQVMLVLDDTPMTLATAAGAIACVAAGAGLGAAADRRGT